MMMNKWLITEINPLPDEPRAPSVPPEERRERVAGLAMQALLSAQVDRPAHSTVQDENGEVISYAEAVARNAVRYTDALMKTLGETPVGQ